VACIIPYTYAYDALRRPLGPNGAGKTTLIKVPAGLLKPNHGVGNVLGYGLPWQHRDIRTWVSLIAPAADVGIDDDLTVRQNLLRARIVRAAGDGLNNTEIARRLAVDADTVHLWPMRWLGLHSVSAEDLPITERLTDAPKPGAPARITAEQVCQVVALACEAPEKAGRPISQWSSWELADEIMVRGIINRILPRYAACLLERGTSNHTASGIG
jgi:putative transposase